MKHVKTYSQYLLPQHALSILAGKIAESKTPWIKNLLIRQFIKSYSIDLSEALITNPDDFSSFNDFFTRQLKSTARSIAPSTNDIACPVDGTIAQIGIIREKQLIQAKNMYFNLDHLFGHDTVASTFYDGSFATLYLAPHNYHRIHMPIDGELIKTIYIPGKLFSVNKMTSDIIPNLYARNERLICIFNTGAGHTAIILVGAMIVGSMQTTWMSQPIRANKILVQDQTPGIQLAKGEELGHFKLGSTVILLFEKNKIAWQASLTADSPVLFGEKIAVQK